MRKIRVIKLRSMPSRIYSFVLSLLLTCTISFGQQMPENAKPQIGKPLPHFELNHVTHSKKTKVASEEFQGKWLFLDFWFPACIACIKSFPKINALQAKFKDQIQFILVGLNYERYQGIESIYEKLRAKQDLDLVAAYDTTLAVRWEIYSMPHIIVVDPSGI
ncbi:MAG: hypothetical protein C0490_03490, partial [Marivirga sp.]|nr:hypothetical protein [Marivirga sp.]